MVAVLILVIQVIKLYIYALILSVIFSWLAHFKIINTGNRFVFIVRDFLHRLTEPALRPIRRFLPNFAGIDISPIILILLLVFVRNLFIGWYYG